MSIKHKLLLSFLAIGVLIGLLGGFTLYRDRDATETVATHEATAIARMFLMFVLHEQQENAEPLAGPTNRRELQANVEQFKIIQNRNLVIVDMRKRIIADAMPREIGRLFSHDKNNEVGQTLRDGLVRIFTEKSEAYPKGIKQVVLPIDLVGGERIGAVVLEYTHLYDEIMQRTREAEKKFLLFYTGALLLSLVLGYFMSRHISKPLLVMKQATQQIANGNLGTRVDHQADDELGQLADSFNKMTESLRLSHSELLRSHQKLEAESILRTISEKALLESEQKFWTIFEFASDALFILDLQGNFIDVNRTAYERLGYTKAELLSRHVSQLDPPEYAAKVPMRMEQLAKQGWTVFESAHVRKDGTVMPVEINARIITLGERKVVFSGIRDITERKLAEEALRQTNVRLHTLIQAIPDMVFFKNAIGQHLIVNKAVEDVLGCRQSQILGKTVAELMPPGPAEACRVSDEEAMRQHTPTHVEEELVDENGRARYFEFVKAPILDSQGNAAGLVTIGRDITERKLVEKELQKYRETLENLVEDRTQELHKANEQLRREIVERERMETELHKAQKLESLGILAGGIAHDFNNLLTTILSNVSMAMLDLEREHPAHKQLAMAERAMFRAKDLTQQLLTFSRGGAPVKRVTLISDLVRESAGFALRGTRIRCDFSVPDDLWLVNADEGQISQVIHNLMINADQAMPDGGTITVSCENAVLSTGDVPALEPGAYVKIAVRDRGIGIPKEYLEKIFDPYFTTKQRGSGLGLATTYSIIRKHGGGIFVESEISAGTTFTLFLPAFPAATKEQVKEDVSLTTGKGTILIMDDEEDIRTTAGNALGRLGYTVAFAEDGMRAIEMYQEAMRAGEPFAVVIMDLTIQGGMGGQETIKLLLEIDPEVKAIVSSGYSNDPVMASYQRYGFAGVVAKPYRIKELGAAVSSVLTQGPQDLNGHSTTKAG